MAFDLLFMAFIEDRRFCFFELKLPSSVLVVVDGSDELVGSKGCDKAPFTGALSIKLEEV